MGGELCAGGAVFCCMITIKADLKPLVRDLKKYRGQFERTIKEVVETEARGFVKDAVESTPPFHAKVHARGKQSAAKYQTVTGNVAKKAGERKIEADMNAIFAGVKLRGKRTITKAFGKELKKKVVVKTVEKHPDLGAVYDQRIKRRFDKGAKRISRGQKAAFYVSSVKLAALKSERKKRVGKLVAGWAPAAAKLKVKLPAWVTRHAARGSVVLRVTRGGYTVKISNRVPFADRLNLQAIADRVLAGRDRKLEARLPFVLKGALRRARMESMAVV